MAVAERVLVHGGGIGGLTLAVALGLRGVQVDVVELREDDGALGVGIIQQSNALHVMREIGVLDECLAAGFEADLLTICDPRGEVVAQIPQPRMDGAPASNGIPRPELSALLTRAAEKAGARIRRGTTIADLTEDDGGVQVVLADGTEGRWDLVVGFDGIGSPLRRRLYGDAYEPEYTGFANWRATVPRDPEVRGVVMSTGNRDVKALLTAISEESMYIASVNAEDPGFRPDPERAHEQFKERVTGFGGAIARALEQITGPEHVVYNRISQVTVDAPWHRGRIVIAGDAAHASTPHLAQGGAMAVEDALVLAQELERAETLPQALAAWEERRRPRALWVQSLSRAVLRQETGQPTTPEDDELLKVGIPGAAHHLVQPY
ncbi:FAD-dependent monooxygenase [Peterkaempfera sp. SMS 1(5)a]|uniref:FAD-dependent monooxygenase n=1 Tax=Peterkaempfera podocarpi TaxID=3232308 RepID=UPI00366D8D6E